MFRRTKHPIKCLKRLVGWGGFLLVCIGYYILPVITVSHASLKSESLCFLHDQDACGGEKVIF